MDIPGANATNGKSRVPSNTEQVVAMQTSDTGVDTDPPLMAHDRNSPEKRQREDSPPAATSKRVRLLGDSASTDEEQDGQPGSDADAETLVATVVADLPAIATVVSVVEAAPVNKVVDRVAGHLLAIAKRLSEGDLITDDSWLDLANVVCECFPVNGRHILVSSVTTLIDPVVLLLAHATPDARAAIHAHLGAVLTHARWQPGVMSLVLKVESLPTLRNVPSLIEGFFACLQDALQAIGRHRPRKWSRVYGENLLVFLVRTLEACAADASDTVVRGFFLLLAQLQTARIARALDRIVRPDHAPLLGSLLWDLETSRLDAIRDGIRQTGAIPEITSQNRAGERRAFRVVEYVAAIGCRQLLIVMVRGLVAEEYARTQGATGDGTATRPILSTAEIFLACDAKPGNDLVLCGFPKDPVPPPRRIPERLPAAPPQWNRLREELGVEDEVELILLDDNANATRIESTTRVATDQRPVAMETQETEAEAGAAGEAEAGAAGEGEDETETFDYADIAQLLTQNEDDLEVIGNADLAELEEIVAAIRDGMARMTGAMEPTTPTAARARASRFPTTPGTPGDGLDNADPAVAAHTMALMEAMDEAVRVANAEDRAEARRTEGHEEDQRQSPALGLPASPAVSAPASPAAPVPTTITGAAWPSVTLMTSLLFVAAAYGRINIVRALIDLHAPSPAPASQPSPAGAAAPTPMDVDTAPQEAEGTEAQDEGKGKESTEGGQAEDADKAMARIQAPNCAVLSSLDLWTGMSALHSSAQEGKTAVLRLLLMSGAPADLMSDLDQGTTPLMLAAEAGHSRAVGLLLEHGADPNVTDTVGNTALRLSAVQMHYGVVERLIRAGAEARPTIAEAASVDMVVPDYFAAGTQPHLNSGMRCILMGWLSEVCDEFGLKLKNLYYAGNYLDRYLAIHEVAQSDLQLLGIVCLYVSALQTHGPTLDKADCVMICDDTYTMPQVDAMIALVTSFLDNDKQGGFKPVIGLTYLNTYIVLAGLHLAQLGPSYSISGSLQNTRISTVEHQRGDFMYFASFLSEISLLHFEFALYHPSIVAAVIVRYTLRILGHGGWCPLLTRFTGVAPGHDAFDRCYQELCDTYAAVLKYMRFSTERRNRQHLAAHPPPPASLVTPVTVAPTAPATPVPTPPTTAPPTPETSPVRTPARARAATPTAVPPPVVIPSRGDDTPAGGTASVPSSPSAATSLAASALSPPSTPIAAAAAAAAEPPSVADIVAREFGLSRVEVSCVGPYISIIRKYSHLLSVRVHFRISSHQVASAPLA